MRQNELTELQASKEAESLLQGQQGGGTKENKKKKAHKGKRPKLQVEALTMEQVLAGEDASILPSPNTNVGLQKKVNDTCASLIICVQFLSVSFYLECKC